MVGKTVRVTRPSRSRPRSVSVSIRCEMPPTMRLISLKRRGPSPSSMMTNTLHLSPTLAGKTFKYGAQGAEGLAGNKRVIVAISRGGFYGAGTPAAVGEHLETYLRWVFG